MARVLCPSSLKDLHGNGCTGGKQLYLLLYSVKFVCELFFLVLGWNFRWIHSISTLWINTKSLVYLQALNVYTLLQYSKPPSHQIKKISLLQLQFISGLEADLEKEGALYCFLPPSLLPLSFPLSFHFLLPWLLAATWTVPQGAGCLGKILLDWKGCDLALICPLGGVHVQNGLSHNVLLVIHYNNSPGDCASPNKYAWSSLAP